MTSLLEKIRAAKDAKAFTEPPFWQLDNLRSPWIGSWDPDREQIENDFEGYIQGAYKTSGVVFACILARQLVFSEARFQWRAIRSGRPGDLFGSPDLSLLENPWPNGTTGELLARMEVTASLAGNFYATVADDSGRLGKAATGTGRRLAYMRPDWVTIIVQGKNVGDPYALDAKIVGYLYCPPQGEEVTLLAEEVAHYSPIPDPVARFRGMSWLTPILKEVDADKAATKHKGKFFTNGATPALAVRFSENTSTDAFNRFVDKFRAGHQGADNAYKTLFLMGGADVTPLTQDFRQLDFSATQGKGETRIAMAARVHPSILGASEGMQGSSLNAGNFGAARRMFVDGTMRPLWRMAAASLQSLVPAPAGASLWYDDRDIAFLREDRDQQAQIQATEAQTIRTLIDAGYEAGSVVAAVKAQDWALLSHSGLFSVQLQEPGTAAADDPAAPPVDDTPPPNEEN